MTDYLHALPSGYRIEEYELVRVLGSGGFGITYLGYDHHLDKAVAIKEYLPNDLAVRTDIKSVLPKSTQDQADYEWGLERFLSEAQTLARFDHRHIIKVHRFFRVHGTGYIVMEYAEGETLSDLLQRKGTLTEAELKQLLLPILDGLETVHEADFLHRDIKPSNIVIRDDGSPVLIDFGSARQAVAGKSRSVTAIVTPGFAPIEQYSANGRQGPWTDIYALGAVCYRCLTGEAPNDVTERLREDPLVPASKRCKGKASKAFLEAIGRALRVDEGERPKTIAAWRQALSVKTDVPANRRRKETTEPTIQPSSSSSQGRWDGPLLVGLVGALVVGAAYWWFAETRKATVAEEIVDPFADFVDPFDIPEQEQIESGLAAIDLAKQNLDKLKADREEAESPVNAPAFAYRSQLTSNIELILLALGYDPGSVDGIYGERTGAAIEAFQRDADIPVDGQISQQLLQALQQEQIESGLTNRDLARQFLDKLKADREEAESPANAPAFAQWSQLTLDIQTILTTLGYNPGSVDGIYGERTRAAIEGFQRDADISVDGQISQQLLQTLQQLLGIREKLDELLDTDTNDNTKSSTSVDSSSGEKAEITDNTPITQNSPTNITGSKEEYFTRGSHQDDVLRLQGTPSSFSRYESLGHETWWFGYSKVKIDLRSKRVLEWDNKGNLNARLLPGKQVTSKTYFTRGSHQDDVLRLQGTPSSFSRYESLGHETWWFGYSKVKIDLRSKRVLEWDNKGNLNARLLPGKQVTSKTYFTRGSHQDDVLRLQGTPSSFSRYESLGHETWWFGYSKVKIDLRSKRVLEWDNKGNLKVKL